MARGGSTILGEIGAGLGAIGDVLMGLRQEQLREALLLQQLEAQKRRAEQEAIRTQLQIEEQRRARERELEAGVREEKLRQTLLEKAPLIEQHLGIPASLLTEVLAETPAAAAGVITQMIPSRYAPERPHITSVGGRVLAIKPSTGEVQTLFQGEDPVEKQMRLMEAREERELVPIYDKQTQQVITGTKAMMRQDPMRYIPASAAATEMREPQLPSWLRYLSNTENITGLEAATRRPLTFAKLLRVRPEEMDQYLQYINELSLRLGIEPEEQIPRPPKPPTSGAVIKPMPER